ncbi:hypothetical protein [uncultured Methanolobus sp.]|uniref:hypothetical protein n=1 Tax=uncultured Methanolobus sp. TaxID=218300 RepID=UPI0029C7C017|nr:hypothetical protein [uncultured Methanolobus sp.]
MNFGFSGLSHFFKDLRSARKADKDNRVDVWYLDVSNNLRKYDGVFSASLDSVQVASISKTVYLNRKGTYFDPASKKKVIFSSYNRASALHPEQSQQDYLSGEQVEGILKAGLFDRVVRPNMTLAVIGFVLGIAITAFIVSTLFLIGMMI